jgi:altered-inheritance-of-mitochondria protein 13
LELHIAQRVAAELEKIHNHEATALEEIRKKIAAGDDTSEGSSISSKLSSSLSSETPKSATSQKVQEEIEKLKQTLGQRKVLKELPKDLDTAYVTPVLIRKSTLTNSHRRQSVISCLRLNDRKPLDCYKEIETFKREVRKLEEGYVSSIL